MAGNATRAPRLRMARPVPMAWLNLLVLERDERRVLQALGELGAVHLAQVRAGPDSAPLEPRQRREELARCDALVARANELLRKLDIPSAAQKPTDGWGVSPAAGEERLLAWEGQAAELLARRGPLLQRAADLASTGERLAPYCGLGLPTSLPRARSFLEFFVGSIPADRLPQLRAEVRDNVVLVPRGEPSGLLPLVAMTDRQGGPALEAALQHACFEPLAMGADAAAGVDCLAEQCHRDQEQVAAARAALDAQVERLRQECAVPLAEMVRGARLERRFLEVEGTLSRTGSAVLLTGWIPAAELAALARRVEEVVGGCHALKATAAEDRPDEDVPILLPHHRLLHPFELLVSFYGLPRYRELVPTLVVAVSFVLMFGMMFGDAGQGALLLVAGALAACAGRTTTIRDVGVVLALDGVSSIVFGVIYGSYFGIPKLQQYALWKDPMAGDPVGFMYVGIGAGALVISLGLLMNIANRFLSKDVMGAVMDRFGVAGLWFYWGVLALLLKHAVLGAQGLLVPALVLLLGVPLTAWVLHQPLQYVLRRRRGQPPEADGLGGVVAESLVGAFEAAIAYLANTVSFVRLAAYALSHAAVLMATFRLADTVEQVPAAGGPLSVLVIIAGNLVAMVLEGIIASVQALRLEYYEFFSKFFSGGGRPFTPFCLAAGGPVSAR